MSATASGGVGSATFDRQAAGFDRRAGLPEAAARAAACALTDLVGRGGGRVLDLGAGTGTIGRFLATEGATAYLGLDRSLAMLTVFQRARHDRSRGLLLCADGDRRWPIADRTIHLIFAARAAHLLDTAHLADEIARIGRPGAVVAIGRVERQPHSIRSTMRNVMRRLLEEHGIEGRSGSGRQRDLFHHLDRLGATRSAPRTLAQWQVEERPAASIEAWRGKGGLAGRTIDDTAKGRMLTRLEAWARQTYGDLDAVALADEHFTLNVTRLPEAA